MKRHPLDPLAFVFGVLFGLMGLVFLVAHVHLSKIGGQWVWPATLAGAGVLLMILTARPVVRPRREVLEPAASVENAQADVDEPREESPWFPEDPSAPGPNPRP